MLLRFTLLLAIATQLGAWAPPLARVRAGRFHAQLHGVAEHVAPQVAARTSATALIERMELALDPLLKGAPVAAETVALQAAGRVAEATEAREALLATIKNRAGLQAQNWFTETVNTSTRNTADVLNQKRVSGGALLAVQEWPSTRQEPWRHFNLARFFGKKPDSTAPTPDPAFDSAASIVREDLEEWLLEGALQVVFVDGIFSPHLSSTTAGLFAGPDDGCFVGSILRLSDEAEKGNTRSADLLSTVLQELDFLPEISVPADPRTCQGSAAFAALNQACLGDCAIVSVPRGTLETHVQVLFVSTGGTAHPRTLVMAGSGAEVNMTQSYCSLGAKSGFTNGLTRVLLGEGSVVGHIYLQEEGESKMHYDALSVALETSSTYDFTGFSLGANCSRINFDTMINASKAHASVDGVMLASDRQCLDMHCSITHAAPDSVSRQQQRNVIADRAEAIWKGRIKVDGIAQLTDSQQLCKSVLLTDHGKVTIMPTLEVIADQVTCTHGATVGFDSANEMFYLNSRGFGDDEARAMLIKATMYGLVMKLPDAKTKQRVSSKISRIAASSLIAEGGGKYISI